MKAPFYGRGIAFPFRINPATGGIQVTEGSDDIPSVGLQFVRESFTAREEIDVADNHIAEAIAHILLTRRFEHDTLPEFGSRLFTLINDPNIPKTQMEFEVWAEESTKRWERRARIPRGEGVKWHTTPDGIDRGELPATIYPEFIYTQRAGNLVSPFVTPRLARTEEYPASQVDEAGHDLTSRYFGAEIYELNGERLIRGRKTPSLEPRHDDQFYKVEHGDTWLLISHKVYGDIRYHWVISDFALNDAAAAGASRDKLNTMDDPEPGTLLRLPSTNRLLMEIA